MSWWRPALSRREDVIAMPVRRQDALRDVRASAIHAAKLQRQRARGTSKPVCGDGKCAGRRMQLEPHPTCRKSVRNCSCTCVDSRWVLSLPARSASATVLRPPLSLDCVVCAHRPQPPAPPGLQAPHPAPRQLKCTLTLRLHINPNREPTGGVMVRRVLGVDFGSDFVPWASRSAVYVAWPSEDSDRHRATRPALNFTSASVCVGARDRKSVV